jgi:NAD(P)H-hydrate epimerase
MRGLEILTTAEMRQADRLAVAAGVPSIQLMENAGGQVAALIIDRFSPRPAVVMCGPGNNGGDGFVVARKLRDAGWPVRIALLGAPEHLKGDAALMAGKWRDPVESLDPPALNGAELLVDAMFGAGLDRPLDGVAKAVVDAANRSNKPIVAVDVPSGIEGDSGQELGAAVRAEHTVTFFRKKPGHLLLPGKLRSGLLHVVDIGIPQRVLDDIRCRLWENAPVLWLEHFPWCRPEGHKYSRGHALVRSGGIGLSGAARLAARAALRIGAGLVTVASPHDALGVNASHLTAVMVALADGIEGWRTLLEDRRKNAVLVGPGNGVTQETKAATLAALDAGKAAVIDADALTVFADAPQDLFAACRGKDCVLTPHAGEFSRVFRGDGYQDERSKLARCRLAAKEAGAVVLAKGADTVVADSEGNAAIVANAPPELATAGAGDVLSGMILGLLAAGMPPFAAACAGAWAQGEAAKAIGPGLIAEDLSEALPEILAGLKRFSI